MTGLSLWEVPPPPALVRGLVPSQRLGLGSADLEVPVFVQLQAEGLIFWQCLWERLVVVGKPQVTDCKQQIDRYILGCILAVVAEAAEAAEVVGTD